MRNDWEFNKMQEKVEERMGKQETLKVTILEDRICSDNEPLYSDQPLHSDMENKKRFDPVKEEEKFWWFVVLATAIAGIAYIGLLIALVVYL